VSLSQQLPEFLEVRGLDEMVIEAGPFGAAHVVFLAPSG
jgi:hypothetical protein